MDYYLSYAALRRRLNMDADLLWSLTPQGRNALCELRNRARFERKYPAFPLLRVCDVEAWAEQFWR